MPSLHPAPSFYDNLDETLAEAWRLFSDGVSDRRSPFHVPTLATIGLDGRPRLRTVVLRACDPAKRQLRFHTDVRGVKADEIARDPRVALHGYDPAAKAQIRIEGHAAIHGADEIASSAWSNSLAISRACYAINPAPGTVLDMAGDYDVPAEAGEDSDALQNFRAVIITATRLEWLYLARRGHRRAVFDLVNHEASWLAP